MAPAQFLADDLVAEHRTVAGQVPRVEPELADVVERGARDQGEEALQGAQRATAFGLGRRLGQEALQLCRGGTRERLGHEFLDHRKVVVGEPRLDSEALGDPLPQDALQAFLQSDLRGRCHDLATALGRRFADLLSRAP
ncbi:hypothetical protein ACFQ9Z_16380 [Streptomyces sp. NPDC056580]|uniref:hypothetical protein n=1 Tax=Streptomyces sp. NPDC056580 TaxID=3345872 RepID=UPI003698853C